MTIRSAEAKASLKVGHILAVLGFIENGIQRLAVPYSAETVQDTARRLHNATRNLANAKRVDLSDALVLHFCERVAKGRTDVEPEILALEAAWNGAELLPCTHPGVSEVMQAVLVIVDKQSAELPDFVPRLASSAT